MWLFKDHLVNLRKKLIKLISWNQLVSMNQIRKSGPFQYLKCHIWCCPSLMLAQVFEYCGSDWKGSFLCFVESYEYFLWSGSQGVISLLEAKFLYLSLGNISLQLMISWGEPARNWVYMMSIRKRELWINSLFLLALLSFQWIYKTL